MFVRDAMASHPLTITDSTTLGDALAMMDAHDLEGLSVVRDGELVGVVTVWDILHAGLDAHTTPREFLSQTTVEKVMSKNVYTVRQDDPIEQAAYVMSQKEVDVLPVLDKSDNVVGVISEPAMLRTFTHMLGLREPGTRITLEVDDRVGQVAAITGIVRDHGVSIASVSTYKETEGRYYIVVRIRSTEPKAVVDALWQAGYKVVHISQVWEET